MRRNLKTVLAATLLVGGIAVAPAVYAQNNDKAPDTQIAGHMPNSQATPNNHHGNWKGHGNRMGYGNRMGQGNMMGHGNRMGQGNMMGRGHMMGQGNMQGMMKMMGQMKQMMATHIEMMQTMMKTYQPQQTDKK